MKYVIGLILFAVSFAALAEENTGFAQYIEPDYQEPRVVYDFYFDDPAKIASALFWIKSLFTPLVDAPYDMTPDFMDIIVVIHGTEIVTVAKHNYEKYRDIVERMRYYAELGVKFRVCSLAAQDFDYRAEDLQEFVELVPSAFTELVHWQQQGYALITPKIMDKKFSVKEIR